MLTARGYDEKGTLICEDVRFTPGDTDHLVLSCEDEYVLSDGWDLAFVTVAALDRAGHTVENARDRVKIHVSGGGRLLGTDNGDSTDTDGYKSDCRRLFSGKLLLIIASNGKKQDITIRISGRNGLSAGMIIPVRPVPIRSGISYGMKAHEEPCSEDISVRRIDICADGTTELKPDHPRCTFRYSVLPAEARNADIIWQATNNAGISAPSVRLVLDSRTVTVCACGDGMYRLRALHQENGKCVFISEMEFSASGFGSPALNPYAYISAGLYDLHDGEISSGNEKGVAFAGDSVSMIGFRRVDFGRTGSDTISADLFALNDEAYDLELSTADENGNERRIGFLHYQKPSIWNVYQRETWKLSVRLTGMQTLCFRMNRKIHMKGFVFSKEERAYIYHNAVSADQIYGDSFLRNGQSVTGIGNNVTLIWKDMDFSGQKDALVQIDGRTDLPVSAITIRARNEKGEETTGIADFIGTEKTGQRFSLRVPDGNCSVSFIFLPGSSFDFFGFRVFRQGNWTETKE